MKRRKAKWLRDTDVRTTGVENYPPYPDSNWDYSVKHHASTKLRPGFSKICIYCHQQCKKGQVILHRADCPARQD